MRVELKRRYVFGTYPEIVVTWIDDIKKVSSFQRVDVGELRELYTATKKVFINAVIPVVAFLIIFIFWFDSSFD